MNFSGYIVYIDKSGESHAPSMMASCR